MRQMVRRSDASAGTAVAICDGWGTTLDNMGLRIASIFIILAGSLLGVFLPIILARTSPNWRFSKFAFFICKYFGSGVILSTAFMHLLSPAVQALSDPCLADRLADYDWGHVTALMTIMVMFFLELAAARFNIGFGHSHGPANPSFHGTKGPSNRMELGPEQPGWASSSSSSGRGGVLSRSNSVTNTVGLIKSNGPRTKSASGLDSSNARESGSQHQDIEAANGRPSHDSFPKREKAGPLHVSKSPPHDVAHDKPLDRATNAGFPQNISYPPGGNDHLGHDRDHVEGDSHANHSSQVLSLFILEFGVVFHSLFIGLSLAGSNNLKILLIVIAFHQFFEGLGLGSRLAVATWPSKWQAWIGQAMAAGYAVTTPIGIAIGLGLNKALTSNPNEAQMVNGMFDAISAGILIYTALVELLAHEFMFNPEMRDAAFNVQFSAYACVAAGVTLMSVLAKWA